MLDLTIVLSSALGVVLANVVVVALGVIGVMYEIRKYTKATEENTEAVRNHTRIYVEKVESALSYVRENREVAEEDDLDWLHDPRDTKKGRGGGPKGVA